MFGAGHPFPGPSQVTGIDNDTRESPSRCLLYVTLIDTPGVAGGLGDDRARRQSMNPQTRALLVSLIGLGFALAALSALPLSAAADSTDVLGPQTVSATVAMPVDIHAEVTAMDCDNSPGPYITLSGELAVG